MNWCDHGHEVGSEVRLLPTGGDGNVHVCRVHYEHEMEYRRKRQREMRGSDVWKFPPWESLKLAYPEESGT